MANIVESIAHGDVRKKVELLISAASSSPSFRSHLLADGRKAVEDFFQLTLPEGVNVRVLEDNESTLTVVLPPAVRASPPPAINVDQLTRYVGAAYSSIIECPTPPT